MSKFTWYPRPLPNAGRPAAARTAGEVWGAMSGQDKLLLIRTR